MNALRQSLLRNGKTVGRRFASAVPRAPVPEMYQAQNQTFKKTFMSDPATYPLMVIMATATTFMIGMGIHAMTSYKDLRITPSAKHKIIQDWGEEQKRPIIAPVASHPFAFHRQSFKDIQYEGLGVNHDEWKKEREAKA